VKYAKLRAFLAGQNADRLPLSFADVAEIAKIKLPASAFRYAQWWENDPVHHVQAKAWIDAGYRTEGVDLAAQRLVFARTVCPAKGVQEMQRSFDHQHRVHVDVHPAYGALRGTFTIAQDWDLTKPALDPEELAEWEANLERKADMIEAVIRRKK